MPHPPPSASTPHLQLLAAWEDDTNASSFPPRNASSSYPNTSAARSAYAHRFSTSPPSERDGPPPRSLSSSSWSRLTPQPSLSCPLRSGTMGSHHFPPPPSPPLPVVVFVLAVVLRSCGDVIFRRFFRRINRQGMQPQTIGRDTIETWWRVDDDDVNRSCSLSPDLMSRRGCVALELER